MYGIIVLQQKIINQSIKSHRLKNYILINEHKSNTFRNVNVPVVNNPQANNTILNPQKDNLNQRSNANPVVNFDNYNVKYNNMLLRNYLKISEEDAQKYKNEIYQLQFQLPIISRVKNLNTTNQVEIKC